ncbi:MAG: hypothetical protein JXB49_14455, partial [Bacteroidales bacterium]|nr:hypothetical protein [Bacteroidales bacterium]
VPREGLEPSTIGLRGRWLNCFPDEKIKPCGYRHVDTGFFLTFCLVVSQRETDLKNLPSFS